MNNKRATKRALLTSVMALVMCVVMLVGTTFAWFTDTASTGVNKIQAGNLDVKLEYKNSEQTSFAEANTNTKVFKDGALWEPGHVEYVVLKISNAGNLALKYKLGINIAGETGSTNVYGDPFKLSDSIKFAVIDGDKSNLGRDNLVAAATDSKLIKDGYTSVETPLYPKVETAVDNQPSEKIVTLVVWMPTDVGNEANHMTGKEAPTIDLGIKVDATQYTHESDSFDNQYDKYAQYPDVDIVTVTPATIPSPFRANTAYFFEAGNYGDQHFVITDKENVTLIGKTGAKFDSLQISSIDYVNPSIGQEVDLDNSTLTVKGFEVAKTLMIVEADKNVVVEDNTAAQITVKANLSSQSIAVNNNIITGGANAANGYGVYIVPNVTDYDLTVTGNSFTNVTSHAISVQGCGDGSAVTAAKSITVSGNTFASYGTNGKTGRAAFKIWEDTKLAPNDTDPLNDAAKALAKSVKDNNHFATLGTNCVVADFYGKTVAFNTNP